jgi:hypothetical protein
MKIPKRDPEVRALCEKFTPDAIETLAEIMQDKDSQPSARVSAAMAILKKTLPDLASQPFNVISQTIQDVTESQVMFKPKAEH